MYITLKLQLAK